MAFELSELLRDKIVDREGNEFYLDKVIDKSSGMTLPLFDPKINRLERFNNSQYLFLDEEIKKDIISSFNVDIINNFVDKIYKVV